MVAAQQPGGDAGGRGAGNVRAGWLHCQGQHLQQLEGEQHTVCMLLQAGLQVSCSRLPMPCPLSHAIPGNKCCFPLPSTLFCGKPPAAILQDIDVAYMADPQMFDDFEADLSSLLEVPDLDFPDSLDLPSGSFRDGSSQQWAVPTADPQALPGAAGSAGQLMSPHPVTTGSTKSSSKLPLSDQTVPDMPSLKRQRV